MLLVVYVSLCVAACLLPVALGVPLWYPDTSPSADPAGHARVLIASFAAVAALTFPLGLVGVLFFWIPVYFGVLTPVESLILSAPIFAASGYLQWFKVLPRVFGAPAR